MVKIRIDEPFECPECGYEFDLITRDDLDAPEKDNDLEEDDDLEVQFGAKINPLMGPLKLSAAIWVLFLTLILPILTILYTFFPEMFVR